MATTTNFFSVALKNVAVDGCSEVCCELGAYYFDKADYEEASLWYYNAAFETKPVLDVECGGGKALHALSECYSRWADEKQKKLDSLPPKSRNVFKGDKELIDHCAARRPNTKSRLRNGCFRRVTSRGCHIKVSTSIYQLVKSSLK